MSLELKQETSKLTFQNTGDPFPDSIDFNSSKTFGLQLIKTMVKQLEGTIELTKTPCTTFTVTFKTLTMESEKMRYND